MVDTQCVSLCAVRFTPLMLDSQSVEYEPYEKKNKQRDMCWIVMCVDYLKTRGETFVCLIVVC